MRATAGLRVFAQMSAFGMNSMAFSAVANFRNGLIGGSRPASDVKFYGRFRNLLKASIGREKRVEHRACATDKRRRLARVRGES